MQIIDMYTPSISAYIHQKLWNTNDVYRLDQFVHRTEPVLFCAHTVFPLKLFPIEVTVDQTKVSIINHFFFFSRQVRSIPLADILLAEVSESLVFATLRIVYRFFPEDVIEVPFLFRPDADKLRRIIEGLIIAQRERIDTTMIRQSELIPRIERLGTSHAAF